MRTIPEELIQYRLPRGYIPDKDQISRIVAQDQFIIDLITTSLLRVPSGTYKAGDNMFIDGTECEALYIPHSSDLVDLPPVFICRAVQYCLNVYKRFHISSILFISKTLRDLLEPVKNKSNLLETPCCHFATSCFMLTKQNVNPFIDNHDTKKLDPLVVFVHFLSSGQQNIIKNDKVEALQTICQATQNQFEKIMTTVFDNPSRAHQYAEAGRHYSAILKIKQYTSRSNNTNGAS
ncbi:uncharacterized protein B0P05DRAFT_528249 [Gilbertella persicaria]|uniref:uncharacterized protein n=1 Tax=Gilbertella persicaria TaxID=101096 RepID=UPI00221E6E25|nr:uncharacterized protein B0P05DRAFT_528249 [Gilbertella persicaria]KAI8090977.1 hypothetical protein B0P05DRAFT_528249 [Gilbertella persicaria]